MKVSVPPSRPHGTAAGGVTQTREQGVTDMSSARRTLKTLAALLPLGALGISSALASTPASARDPAPAVAAQGSALEQPGDFG